MTLRDHRHAHAVRRLGVAVNAIALAIGLASATTARAQSLPAQPDSMSAAAREALRWFVPFMGGEWKADGDIPDNGRYTATRTFGWALDSTFVRVEQTMRIAGGAAITETMYIGWDPVELRLRIWSFASDGSYSDGYEVKGEDPRRWMAEGRTFGGRSNEWRLTMFPSSSNAFSLLLEVRSGREFTPALTMAFRR